MKNQVVKKLRGLKKKERSFLTNVPSKDSLLQRLTSDTFSTRNKKNSEKSGHSGKPTLSKKKPKPTSTTQNVHLRPATNACSRAIPQNSLNSGESHSRAQKVIKSKTKKKSTRRGVAWTSTKEVKHRVDVVDISLAKEGAKDCPSKVVIRKQKSIEQKGSFTQRKPKARGCNLYNSTTKSTKKVNEQNFQNTHNFYESEGNSETIPFPSPMREELGQIKTLESEGSFTNNSPDFKINLTDQSNIIIKDSNKSLQMDSTEEQKFCEVGTKDSNFIEIAENEISPQKSFSREVETRIRQAPEVTSLPHVDDTKHKSEALMIELEQKTSENNRLQREKDSLHQQMTQYEEMLSKMNHEYEKILNDKIKDSLRITESEKQILSLTQQLNNTVSETEHRIATLDSQLKETQRDLEIKNQVIETSKKTISDLEADITANLNQNVHINKNETELRHKIDELNAKVVNYEAKLREHNEQFYIINTENDNLKSDIQSLSSIEKALRDENATLIRERQELENTLQMLKAKVSQDSLQLRKYDSELATLNRQIMSMQNSIILSNKEVEDLRKESTMLKESINNKENENILLKKTLYIKSNELKSCQESLEISNSLQEAHQAQNEFYTSNKSQRFNDSEMKVNEPNEFSSAYKKATVRNSIASMISPYDSPITSFRRQKQAFRNNLTRSSVVGREISAPPGGLEALTPIKCSEGQYRESSPINESFSRIDDGGYEFVQKQLKSMTLEKKRLENEYSRLPIVIDKSPSIKRKKEFLENQLNLLEKNIDSYTIRLREFTK